MIFLITTWFEYLGKDKDHCQPAGFYSVRLLPVLLWGVPLVSASLWLKPIHQHLQHHSLSKSCHREEICGTASCSITPRALQSQTSPLLIAQAGGWLVLIIHRFFEIIPEPAGLSASLASGPESVGTELPRCFLLPPRSASHPRQGRHTHPQVGWQGNSRS